MQSKAEALSSPLVTVDIVLLTLKDEQLCAALLQREREPHAGEWTLPGGFVHVDEDEDALATAARILKSKVGIDSPYLEQLQTFSGPHRDPRGWSVAIVYYALVPHHSVPTEDALGSATQMAGPPRLKWRPVDSIRSLPFDHLQILRTAVERVRSKTLYSSLPVHLMPATFTLSELQAVYEVLLGTQLDKRGFRRRIDELDVVEEAPGAPVRGAHRPAQRYRMKRRGAPRLAIASKNLGG